MHFEDAEEVGVNGVKLRSNEILDLGEDDDAENAEGSLGDHDGMVDDQDLDDEGSEEDIEVEDDVDEGGEDPNFSNSKMPRVTPTMAPPAMKKKLIGSSILFPKTFQQ